MRLAILKYKPLGTKLSFRPPTIEYDLPIPLVQGRIRDVKRAKRDNLNMLRKPIDRLKLWYNPRDPEISYFMSLAQQGLDQLDRGYAQYTPEGQAKPVICETIGRYIDDFKGMQLGADSTGG